MTMILRVAKSRVLATEFPRVILQVGADKSNHSVKDDDEKPDAGPMEQPDTKGVTTTIDHNLRGLSLSSPTAKGVRELKKKIESGSATQSDVKNTIEDLGFDLAKLQSKKDSTSKRTVKQLNGLVEFLKSNSVKKVLK